MKRHRFLVAAGGALSAFALAIPSQRARAAAELNVALTAAPLPLRLPNGKAVTMLAYNGRCPGPVLRVTRGQRIRVHYRNLTDIPTSVHWHGQIIPNDMDGVAGITQPPVMKNGTFTYEFEPAPSGTRWYHDHAFHLGMPRGLYGLFIIDEPSDEPADVEYALVFHDIVDMTTLKAAMRGVSRAASTNPPGSPEVAEMRAGMPAMPRMSAMPGMSGMSAMPGMPAKSRMSHMAMQPMGDAVGYRGHFINGKAYPRTEPLAVR
ncbi:MAG: multicopper oxidase domain-containing protein, partial [Vulcanimicrobiaceae bacterium]